MGEEIRNFRRVIKIYIYSFYIETLKLKKKQYLESKEHNSKKD